MKKCGNCLHRCSAGWFGMEPCIVWEQYAETEEDEIKIASSCERYEEEKAEEKQGFYLRG